MRSFPAGAHVPAQWLIANPEHDSKRARVVSNACRGRERCHGGSEETGMGYSRPTHSLTVEADYCLPPLRRYHSAAAAKLGASSSSSFSSNSSTPSAAGTYESIGSLSVSQSMLGTGSVCHGCVAESSSCRGCGCRVICQWIPRQRCIVSIRALPSGRLRLMRSDGVPVRASAC